MKSYQFSKIYKRFYKEREKNPTQTTDKEERFCFVKSWILFYNMLFYKAL